jgi:hypothetical protein
MGITTALIVWTAAMITSGILSFVLKARAWRIVLRITAIVMACVTAVPLTFLIVMAAGLGFIPGPPSETNLAKNFPSRRPVLEQILAMSDQDTHYSRIDPGFIDFGYIDGQPGGQSMHGDKNSPLASSRWDAYRALFSRAKLSQGFQRDADGNVFFMAGSEGLLDRGFSIGYLYCRDQNSPAQKAANFEPCNQANQDSGSEEEPQDGSREAFSFRKLSGRWFVYRRGPG